MLHYSETAKTKSGEIKISRPIFAVLLTGSGPFSGILNEKISIDVERNNGSNTNIANQYPLSALCALATHGMPAIKSTALGWSALVPIASGAIPLKESESIKISLFDLRSAETYSVSSVEHPSTALTPFKYDQKVVVSDDVSRNVEIQGFTKMMVNNASAITQIAFTHQSGIVNRYEIAEIIAIAEADDAISILASGLVQSSPTDAFILDVSEIVQVEVYKASGTSVFLYLRN
jgi:hypothetical protein